MVRVCVLMLLTGLMCPSIAAALTADEVLDAMPFSADDDRRIKNGELVSTTLPSSSNRELAVAMAFTMPVPPAIAVSRFRAAIYRNDPKIIGWGKIASPGSIADFAALTLGQHGAEEAQRFLNAAPGETLNLSTQEIAAFAALRAGQPGAAEVQTLVEQQLRAALLARLQAYRRGGLAGIAPYARADGGGVDPGKELIEATDGSVVLARFAAPVRQFLLAYPRDVPANVEEIFHWAVFEIRGRPTVTLSHRIWVTVSDTAIMVDRLYYVSTGFNTEQAIGGFLGVPDGTIVVYSNRTSTDQVDGFASAAKRAIGDHMMESQLSATFQKLRDGT